MKKGKQTQIVNGLIAGGIISIALVTILTVVGDLYSPLKDWLKVTFSHHWIGKGVLSTVALILGGIGGGLFEIDGRKQTADKLLSALAIVLIVGIIALLLFYYYEAFLVTH